MEDLEEPSLDQPLLSSSNDEEEEEEITALPPTSSYAASATLLFVSFLFATLNVGLRSLYTMKHPATPSEVNAVRGWFTVTLFLPIVLARRQKQVTSIVDANSDNDSTEAPSRLVQSAFELALWNFGGQVLVNLGLLSTTSARASFLGQTVVVLVPLLSWVWAGEKLTKLNGIGCLCSIGGVILLSANNQDSFQLHTGDLFILASAVCFSCYLIRITQLASHYDEVFLQGTKNSIMAGLYTLWWGVSTLFSGIGHSFLWSHSLVAWAILAYTAFGPGVLADILQQQAQKVVGATHSNLILCTSSVFTALLARVTLGEETSAMEKWGGFLLITGAVVAGSSNAGS